MVRHWYAEDYYAKSPRKDPPGPETGTSRVLRGGSWFHYALGCRAAHRYRNDPGYRFPHVGFRVVCVSPRTP